MSLIEALLQLAVMVAACSWMTASCFPNASAGMTAFLRTLFGGLLRIFWVGPVRHFGPVLTVWIWLCALAALATLLAALSISFTWAWLDQVLGVLQLWLVIISLWLVVRAYARWRFAPKPLPTRRR